MKDRHIDAAYRVLRLHFDHMTRNEPGTRLGEDPEFLHDMRVASRRMRAALRVFADALPARRVASLKRDLQWVGDALGAVRDLDVYLLRLSAEAASLSTDSRSAFDAYCERLRAKREKARGRMLRVLDTRRYADFLARTERFLASGPPCRSNARGEIRASRAAAKVVTRALKRTLRAGRKVDKSSSDEDLHRLRIRCKRLRYACEFFEDVFGKPAAKFAARTTDLQDVLGEHQDAVVARRMLLALAESGVSAGGGRCAALGELVRWEEGRAAKARSKFAKAWRRYDRKKVRAPLLKALRNGA